MAGKAEKPVAPPPPAGVKLYDRKTGDAVTFDTPDEAQAAFARGEVKPKSDQRVSVVSSKGTIGSVDAKDLSQMIRAGGRLASGEEVHGEELKEKYGGIGGTIGAAAAGAARGLSVGLSDVALTENDAFGDSAAMRERLNAYRDLHPGASIGGELGGVALSMLVPGAGEAGAARLAGEGAELASAARGIGEGVNIAREAGTLSRGAGLAREGVGLATALPRGVSEVGAGVERGLASLVGEGAETLGGKVLQKAIPLAGRSAVEGGIYGAGTELSEAALRDDPDLSAEKLFAGVAHGALTGAVLGAGLGGAGAALQHGAEAALTKLSPKLTELAGEQAWKALSPLKKFSEEANARAGGTSAVGRTLLEEGVIPRTEGFLATARNATPEELLPRITEAKERIGQAIGNITEQSGGKVNAKTLLASIDEAIAPHRAKAGFEQIAESLDSYTKSLFEKLGAAKTDSYGVTRVLEDASIPVQDVLAQRKALDELVYKEAKSLDPKLRVEFMRDIRARLESTIMGSIDEAAKTAGTPEVVKELAELKRTYQHLSIAEKAAETSTWRMATNRTFSLSDNLAAVGAVASGHLLAGPVAAYGHSLVRERGNAVTAVLFDKLAALGAIDRQAAKVDGAIDKGVRRFFKGERPSSSSSAKASENPTQEYERRVREVRDAQVDPVRAKAKALAKVGNVAEHAPQTVDSYSKVAARAISFLATRIPKGRVDPYSPTPHLEKPAVSELERDRFLDFARAVDNPTFVVKEFQKGTVTRDQVQALKAVYPKLYDQIVARVGTQLTEQKEPMPYQKLVQLSTLLDKPLDETMTPKFIRDMQASNPPPQAPPPPPPSGPPPQTVKMSQTSMQRIEAR